MSAYALTVERGTVFGSLDARRAAGAARRRGGGRDVRARARERSPPPGSSRTRSRATRRRIAESRHNRLYWSLGPYLGVGASAASFRPLADGTGWRFSNPRATDVYLRGRAPRATSSGGRAADLENEAVWLGLRTAGGIDRAAHRARHGVDPVVGRELEIERSAASGWIVVDEARVRLTPAGELFADEVAARLWK